ncbi:MAG TPA: hypothetical protein VGT61_09910 [Thermomicrobiales bacterium]|nr:hypothetical protein [Thermomicrobiales bacterium]
MPDPYADILHRAVAHHRARTRATAPQAQPEPDREPVITAQTFAMPINTGSGWHEVGLVTDASLPHRLLRVRWHPDTGRVSIEQPYGTGYEDVE